MTSRRAPTNARVAAKAATRVRILAAAEVVFTGTDLADARVADILTHTGVSRRTFYQHFANKEEVAGALMERAVAGLLESSGALVDVDISVSAKVARTVGAYFELWRDHGPVMLGIIREAMRPGSSLAAPRQRAYDAAVVFIRGALRGEGIEVSEARARFAIFGAEALLMHHVARGEPLGESLREEVVAGVQCLLLGGAGR